MFGKSSTEPNFKLKVLQNRAARVIAGARFDVNSANVLEDNGPRSM